MALYVPASRRRRRLLASAAAAGVLGLGIGGTIGRSTAPDLAAQVSAVRADARSVSAELRVLALHAETGVSKDGTAFGLQRARTHLAEALKQAPWMTADERRAVEAELTALSPDSDAASIEAAAASVDRAFGSDDPTPR